MNILWHIRFYPPGSNCGSDWYAHELNKFFISVGHSVKVMLSENDAPYNLDGVGVIPKPVNWGEPIAWADIIFTHLDFTPNTCQMVQRKPIVWIMHNTFDYSTVRRNKDRVKVVYNSEAAKEHIWYPNESFVLPPPVDIDYYRVTPGDCITLINLNEAKGAEVFYKLAELMPNQKFLGVKGSYGKQIVKQLPNVEILETQTDIREVYKRTRILIMPSSYESWGRTATEAMASGIPVICTDTFGLRENCGDAGIYCDRKDIQKWVEMIEKLQGKKEYIAASKKARKRAEQLRPDTKLEQFDKFIHHITKKEYDTNRNKSIS